MKLPYNDTKIVTTKTGRPNNKYTIISVDNESTAQNIILAH